VKRFWREARAVRDAEGWHVELDARRVKTQGGRALTLPSETIARMLAAEWDAQGEEVDPRSFRFRDMADYAIDVVAQDRDAAIASLLRFAETDTLCYRADPDEALWKRQQEVWEPLLAACEAREGVRFQRVSGVIHRPQAPETLSILRQRLEACDMLTLAALMTLASLAASLTVALAVMEPDSDAGALWDAANLEEDWQADLWGKDEEAAPQRARRREQFLAAAAFLRAVSEQ